MLKRKKKGIWKSVILSSFILFYNFEYQNSGLKKMLDEEKHKFITKKKFVK